MPRRLSRRMVFCPPLVRLLPLARDLATHPEGAARSGGKHQKAGPSR
jgi:hypothetical protein